MWKSRYIRRYKTSDPNLIITAVCAFPNIQNTLEKAKEYYEIDKTSKDEKYRDILAYYHLVHGGNEFIPIALSDTVPKLEKLQKLTPIDKSYFWCIAYVSPCLEGAADSVGKQSNSIKSPSYDVLLDWLKHFVTNYDSSEYSSVSRKLFNDALRKYINDYAPSKLHYHRKFDMIYNNSTFIEFTENRNLTPNDWVAHLENLLNRDIYEIITNDFR